MGFIRLLKSTRSWHLGRRIWRRSAFVLLAFAALSASPACSDAPGLNQRPMTQVQMIINTIKLYQEIPEIMLRQLTVQDKLNALKNKDAPSYDRGADFGEILDNSLHDILKILGNFFPCWDWSIIGLCMKISWTGVSFAPYTEYRLPMHKVDNHPQDLQHHYIPSIVNKALLTVNELVYYNMVKTVGEYENDRMKDSMELQSSFADFEIPSGFKSAKWSAATKSAIIDGISKDERHRGGMNKISGWIKNEYTVLPELFRKVLENIPYSDCHNKLGTNLWSSDYPTGILPARWSAISFLVSPLEMINHVVFPHTCAGLNTWFQGGKTPPDFFLTGNTTWDAMNLAWPSYGCLKGNNQTYVPYKNGAYSSFPSGAANIGIVKGMKVARYFQSGSTYKFDFDRDRIQWTRNNRMPDNCSKIGKYPVNFNAGNYQNDTVDPWYIAEVWKYFRCCPKGYFVLIGPTPQIKQ